jgi:hypothetical protein
MALGATDRQPQKGLADGVDAINYALDAELFGIDAALLIEHRVAQKTRGHAGLQRRLRQQIARQLFDRELIERHVFVERVDYPVAIWPDRARAVFFEPVGVGVSRGVEPPSPPPLAVMRAVEQAIDQFAVSGRAAVARELIDLFDRRRQSGQIETQTANQRDLLRLGRRRESLFFKPGENEVVNRRANPGAVFDLRRRGANRLNKSPALLDCGLRIADCGFGVGPFGSFVNPFANQLDLIGLERGVSSVANPCCFRE